MKNAKLVVVFCAVVFPAILHAAVHVKVINVNSSQGNVFIGIFKSADDFNDQKEYAGKIIKAGAPEMKLVFEKLPPGWYMIAVYHDLNSNGKLDKNIINTPVEPYGFSLNRMGLFGPSFEKSKFYYDGKDIHLEIKLMH